MFQKRFSEPELNDGLKVKIKYYNSSLNSYAPKFVITFTHITHKKKASESKKKFTKILSLKKKKKIYYLLTKM